ncbi:MAG: DUF4230 domain-containing protein [Clostridiales bacterium]|nr:DUF4230 domain-containing protein [Clostridiales bacterium]
MSETERPNADLIRDEARSEAVRAEAAGKSRRREPEDVVERTDREPRRRFRFHHLRWIFRGVVLAAVIVAILFLLPRIERFFTPDVNIDLPDSFSSLLPDETLGYSKIDFSEAILGESREKSDFVVLEQDITVTTRVSQALANLALFEKSQIVRSFGTGVYTVDLSGLTDAEIALDTDARLVTVSIPHAALSYVTVDVEKTEFEETKKALFAFGEIKLTNEQLNLLEQNIQDSMTEQLSGEEMLVKADAAALKQVRQLFSPIVRAVAEEYSVQIEFAP